MPRFKLGKRAPKLDPRTLKLAKYLPPKLENPPTSMGYMNKVASWPMLLNDSLGDCTVAAAAHMIQQWTTFANPPGFTPSPQQVLAVYEDVSGYVVGDPSTDNGAFMLDVLKYWRKTHIGGHGIVAYVSVDFTNQMEVEQAVAIFGNCYIGVALPVSAQDQSTWAVPPEGPWGDGSPGSWGGHCIPIVGYGATGCKVVSWGTTFGMTWNFLRTYCDEAWAVLSNDWLEASGFTPSVGNPLNLNQLEQDLLAIADASKKHA